MPRELIQSKRDAAVMIKDWIIDLQFTCSQSKSFEIIVE